jgi:hypothetical protein
MTMTSLLRTYNQRAARITAILEPYLHVSCYLLWRLEPDQMCDPDALACRWFDAGTGRQEVAVVVKPIGDVHSTLIALREDVDGKDQYERGMAAEVTGCPPDGYAFLQYYASAVTVIAGNCEVKVSRPHERLELHALVEPALEIARTVGCCAYYDDFVQPDRPAEWPTSGWLAGCADPNAPRTEES